MTSSNSGSSGGGECGCFSSVLFLLLMWALLFGVSVDGKHYGIGCSCDAVIPEDGTHKRKNNDMTIDHDYPLCLGGMNIPQNLVILCTGCHRKKDKWIGVG